LSKRVLVRVPLPWIEGAIGEVSHRYVFGQTCSLNSGIEGEELRDLLIIILAVGVGVDRMEGRGVKREVRSEVLTQTGTTA
jgi:hypothetical protein